MSPLSSYLSNLKEFLLVVTILYFYGLAFSMSFGKPLFGLDRPAVFLTMCTLYLVAIGYELVSSWWKSKAMVLWTAIWILSYGIIGLYLAPTVFGQWIVGYVLFEPLIIVFMGGFAFSFGNVLASHFTAKQTLGRHEVSEALEQMPGWQAEQGGLVRDFEFADFSSAINFVNQVGRVADNMKHYPNIRISGRHVRISVTTRHGLGLTKTDLIQARKIDAI